jgi:release factor glutamine methyltransferase
LNELPNAAGIGTDISRPALQTARTNVAQCGLKARGTLVACDMAAGVQGPFDLVVSNPPYIVRGEIGALAPEVRDYDPIVALDGGDDGLTAYRSIAADAKRLLASGGRLFVELGAGQEPSVRTLFTKAGLSVGIARKDLAGTPRVLGAGFVP